MDALLLVAVVGFMIVTRIQADSVLILGGHVHSILEPATAEVETFGPCGIFNSGVPPLPEPRRDFAAALLGRDVVVCGGYQLIVGGRKDCIALTLGEWPLVWRQFATLNHGRHSHSMMTVGGSLYVVGGSALIGSSRSLERYNSDLAIWEEAGDVYGFREDFCAVPFQNDGIMVIGGYDNMGDQQHVELFNITTQSWTALQNLNTPRGLHSCTNYRGGIVAAGGWTPNNSDPDFPTQEPTKTDEWYDPVEDTWADMAPMRHRRTDFSLAVVNGTLTAFGGYEGYYVDTIEFYNEGENGSSRGWSYHSDRLLQAKAAFGVVNISDILEDPDCVI